MTMSEAKYRRLKLERGIFVALLSAFWSRGTDRLPLGEVLALGRRLEQRSPYQLAFLAAAALVWRPLLGLARRRSRILANDQSANNPEP